MSLPPVKRPYKAWGSRAAEAEIAFFGGSFTAIDRGYMLRLLDAARPYVRAGKVRGIRLSTRPDAVEPEVLSLLREYGVTTIELGAQSMDDRVLALNGRGHTADQVRRAACRVREMGFSLGLQMMTGLPRGIPLRAPGTPPGSWQPSSRRRCASTPRWCWTAPAWGSGTARALTSPPGESGRVFHSAPGLLEFFEGQGIRVIRLGLHASRSLEERLLGRAYHPAFRELCEGELLVQRLLRNLAGRVPGPVTVRLNPRDRSKFTGPRRQNLTRLAELGWQVTIREDTEIPAGQILPELE